MGIQGKVDTGSPFARRGWQRLLLSRCGDLCTAPHLIALAGHQPPIVTSRSSTGTASRSRCIVAMSSAVGGLSHV